MVCARFLFENKSAHDSYRADGKLVHVTIDVQLTLTLTLTLTLSRRVTRVRSQLSKVLYDQG